MIFPIPSVYLGWDPRCIKYISLRAWPPIVCQPDNWWLKFFSHHILQFESTSGGFVEVLPIFILYKTALDLFAYEADFIVPLMQRHTWKVVGQSCRYRLGPMCVEVGNWLHQAGEWCKLEGLMCWRWERVPLRCEIIEHSGSCLYRKSQCSNLLYKK